MGRASASSSKKSEVKEEQNPEVLERRRLKKLALSNKLMSETPARTHSPLAPSKTVIKHHGKDILKKSQRKNRYLFSFPGLLAPIGGGKIGELKDLGTKNPILYLHFPQGQMKLFGTIVYPKNRYLTLQFSRGGKNVMCEDYFDNMILFSDAWWIGKKEENQAEARLDFPTELTEGQLVDYDFKGGAGAGSVNKQVVNKNGTTYAEEESPQTELENDSADDKTNLIALKEVTPVRQSERTAGKTFKFAEVSSGDDTVDSDADMSEEEAKKGEGEGDDEEEKKVKTNTSAARVLDIENEGALEGNVFSKQILSSAKSANNSKKLSKSVVSMTKSVEDSCRNHSSLVQSTISTLFKKVEKEKATTNSRKSPSSKVSGKKSNHADLKRKIDQDEGPRKRGKMTEEKKAVTGAKVKKKDKEVEDDDIEEFSSSSQGTSDEDWAA